MKREELHILFTSEVIIIPSDIIFSCVITALDFDDDEWLSPSIRKSMKVMCGDIASFIGSKHTDLFDLRKVWMTDIDCRDS